MDQNSIDLKYMQMNYLLGFSPPFFFVCRFIDVTEYVRQDPISPISGDWIKDSIQLDHTHSFRVQAVHFGQQAQPTDKI